jgi:hypothetical protein
MFHVSCQNCGAWTLVQGGPCQCEVPHVGVLPDGSPQMCSGHFHEALDATGTCHCCPEDHNHRLATIETGKACRPVHIVMMAGSAVTTVSGA